MCVVTKGGMAVRKLFDFNRDGERSFGEEMLSLGLIGAVLQAAEQEELARQAELEAVEEAGRIADIKESLDGLREQLSKLEDMLCRLQDKEPENIDSPAYSRWEERCEALEEKISELEYAIEEAEAALEL